MQMVCMTMASTHTNRQEAAVLPLHGLERQSHSHKSTLFVHGQSLVFFFGQPRNDDFGLDYIMLFQGLVATAVGEVKVALIFEQLDDFGVVLRLCEERSTTMSNWNLSRLNTQSSKQN